MRLYELGFGAIGCAAAYLIAVACSSGGDTREEPFAVPSADADSEKLFGSELKQDAECRYSCSPDLHAVVDCNQRVINTCPSDKGCSGGECIPACQAADNNKSTYGCEYYSVDPAEYPSAAGSCFAAYVVNTWDTEIAINVEYRGEKLDTARFARVPSGTGTAITYGELPQGKLPAGKAAILFLAHHPESGSSVYCPSGIRPAVDDANVKAYGTSFADAFHITTDRPVAAYDIYPYGGASAAVSSATLLIPTSAWGSSYVAQAAFSSPPDSMGLMQPFVQIVAKENNTIVSIRPTANIEGSGTAGISSGVKGQELKYTVNKGQILQISQEQELTGSVIVSDGVVGLWGGQNCVDIGNKNYCDSAHQQIPPVTAFGSEYAAVRYRNRLWYKNEAPPWRLVGVKDGTNLSYSGKIPDGAPASLNAGEIVTLSADEPFIVKSQDTDHPFYLSGHMTGGGEFASRGDPEWVNVVPTSQYLSRYVFFTDPTYPETSLVIVRARNGNEFRDVTLDCAGVLEGWTQIGINDEFEYARVDLVKGAFEPQGGCDNGLHTILSSGPFALTVWGWGNGDVPDFPTVNTSYAYPGGAGVRQVNSVMLSTVPR